MRESARADKRRAHQGDRMGDPKATKPDREGSLPPSFDIQERGAKDTCNPNMKSTIKSTKSLKDVGRGTSAEEVNDFAKP